MLLSSGKLASNGATYWKSTVLGNKCIPSILDREPPPSHTAAKVRRCYVAENGTRHTAEAHRRAAPPPLNQSASSRREEEREGRHQASAALRSKAAAATAPTRRRRWREAPEEQGRSSPLLCFYRCSTCQGDGEASRCRWSRSLEGHRLSRSSLLLANGVCFVEEGRREGRSPSSLCCIAFEGRRCYCSNSSPPMERSAGRTGSKLAIALLLPLLNMSRRWGGLTLPLESLAGRPPVESIVVAAG
nr:hypothetical protein Iba_chr01aCG16930 [Ipomoea batatas]